ncbi:DUF4139 domain-containing protein [Candidatus Latescibacterota bacterium]
MKYLVLTALVIIFSGFSGSYVYSDDISLSVYNDDLAIVKISDVMSFEKGIQTITFTNVSKRVDPTSVRFSSVNGGINVLEQNFRYDLVNSQKVLERYIDKKITIWVKDGELIEGVLMSVAGDVVVNDNGGNIKIVKLNSIERFEFPELPEGLVTKPTLFWKLRSERKVETAAEVSYMTAGFDWHAEYTAVIDESEKKMEVSSWVSIDNNSGATYDNAKLKLIAGDVNRIKPEVQYKRMPSTMAMQQEDAAGSFEERGLFEYHLYELQGRTTVNNAEIKQISLFPNTAVKAEKLLIYDPRKNPTRVTANIEFTNSERDGLGMPLPAGIVRVYKSDTDGAVEFIGEDAIKHTPKNEKVRLALGTSFDITAERKVADSNRISRSIIEESIEIIFRNRKEETVSITAVEHFWRDWDIINKSDDFVKKDAFTAEFTVEIPAGSEKIISYTVRHR